MDNDPLLSFMVDNKVFCGELMAREKSPPFDKSVLDAFLSGFYRIILNRLICSFWIIFEDLRLNHIATDCVM
jgi:hypothetical protein